MCPSMVNIQCAAAEIRRGKNDRRRRKKPQGENIMVCPIPQGDHNEMFVMLVIVDCIMLKACVYLSHQCITLVASVNSVNLFFFIFTSSSAKLS